MTYVEVSNELTYGKKIHTQHVRWIQSNFKCQLRQLHFTNLEK